MKWSEICNHYPHRFVLVEAIKASSKNRKRTLEEITVVEDYDASTKSLDGYKRYPKESPEREFYIFHTSKENVDVVEEYFSGIRGQI